jgi:hypothetical protein
MHCFGITWFFIHALWAARCPCSYDELRAAISFVNKTNSQIIKNTTWSGKTAQHKLKFHTHPPYLPGDIIGTHLQQSISKKITVLRNKHLTATVNTNQQTARGQTSFKGGSILFNFIMAEYCVTKGVCSLIFRSTFPCYQDFLFHFEASKLVCNL